MGGRKRGSKSSSPLEREIESPEEWNGGRFTLVPLLHFPPFLPLAVKRKRATPNRARRKDRGEMEGTETGVESRPGGLGVLHCSNGRVAGCTTKGCNRQQEVCPRGFVWSYVHSQQEGRERGRMSVICQQKSPFLGARKICKTKRSPLVGETSSSFTINMF